MNDQPAIRSMPLYTHLDRIERGLAARGIGPGDPIPPEALFPLDQWHYHGTEAIGAAGERLSIGPKSRVLDIGSGIGGPARYLAYTTGCHVTALELQPELHEIAVGLTQRSGLADRVTHFRGDALTYPLPRGTFDAAVSFLAVLHVANRPRLCARIAAALRPGGGLYIEDLCMRAPFSPQDLQDLRTIVFGITVTTIDDYIADLRSAGFTSIDATDLTSDWAPYAAARLLAWRQDRARYSAAYGDGAYAAQELFYAVIARLYESGSLGGIRLIARMP